MVSYSDLSAKHTQRTACLLSKIYAVDTGQPRISCKITNIKEINIKIDKLLVVPRGNNTFAFPSPDGGTGRRARLKIWLSQGSAGSIPVLGTKLRGLTGIDSVGL